MSKEIDDAVLALYQPKKLLGSGAYGHVWKVIEKSTKKQYALKKIFDAFQNSVDAQRTYRQITILHELDHINIIKLKSVMRAMNNRDLYLVFEHMEADLHSLVGEDVLQPVHLRFIIYQILRALRYLHSAQAIHRDLKPSNILINSQCEIKVCDFGLVRSLTHEEDKEMILSEEVATRWYRSPQILLSSRKYSKATDVWSVGCIIAELLIGKPIFPGSSTLDQLEMIVEFCGMPSKESMDSLQSQVAENLINQLSVRKKSLTDYFPPGCDKEIIKLVTKMLEFNPKKRITIDQALKCPILAEFSMGMDENELCTKMIFPQVDDNVRLSVVKYRQIIYKDIERRYPAFNSYVNIPSQTDSASEAKSTTQQIKFQRSHHSLKKAQPIASVHESKNSCNSLQKNQGSTASSMYAKYKNKEPLHHSLQQSFNDKTPLIETIPADRQNSIKKQRSKHSSPKQRSQNSVELKENSVSKPKKNQKMLKRIEQSNPLQCYIVKNDKLLPQVRSKKLLHKSSIKNTCKPLMDFQSKISKLRN